MAKSQPDNMSVKLRRVEDPLERKVTRRQAEYFAANTGFEVETIAGAKVGDLAEKLKWHIDPSLWFYQRVCGRVVKTDPITGEKRGVPFATVTVEDTDCSFLGLFPVEHPYFWWLWPINCDREVMATVMTDECGYFCVNIPRWDIDRLLRWRKERICFPEIFRPRIPDLVERVPVWPPGDPDPIDPAPWLPLLGDRPVRPRPVGLPEFGETPRPQLLEGAIGNVAPPLAPDALERAAALLGKDYPMPAPELVVGPFLRCRDVYVPEWKTFIDVPDITFRVTQDVDGDGTEEVIYSEGLFDVRWNDSSIGDVELEAAAIAKASSACDLPPVACSDVAALLQVGRMPTAAAYLDGDGFAIKVNRPRAGGDHPGGAKVGDAASPFTGELQISGCYDSVDGATYFRMLDDHNGVEAPILGVSWTVASPTSPFWVTMTPDGDGWYSVADAQKQLDDHLVMSWPVAGRGQGRHDLRLEIGDATKGHLEFSQTLPLVIDDKAPEAALLSVRWRVVGDPTWPAANELVGATCPIVGRPVGQKVEMRVVWTGSGDHFRNTELVAAGCAGGPAPVYKSGAGNPAIQAGTTVRRWHTTPAEGGLTRTETYEIGPAPAFPQGAYSFSVTTESRAFEPAGAAGPAADWDIDRSDRYRRVALRYAVIDS